MVKDQLNILKHPEGKNHSYVTSGMDCLECTLINRAGDQAEFLRKEKLIDSSEHFVGNHAACASPGRSDRAPQAAPPGSAVLHTDCQTSAVLSVAAAEHGRIKHSEEVS